MSGRVVPNAEVSPRASGRRRWTGTTSASASGLLPEDVQAPVRQRLRLARTARGMAQREITACSTGQVTQLETADISTLKLGTLYRLGLEYGFEFREWLDYLFFSSATHGSAVPKDARALQRLMLLVRRLSEDDLDVLLEVLAPLVGRLADAAPRASLGPIERRSGRALLAARAAKDDGTG